MQKHLKIQDMWNLMDRIWLHSTDWHFTLKIWSVFSRYMHYADTAHCIQPHCTSVQAIAVWSWTNMFVLLHVSGILLLLISMQVSKSGLQLPRLCLETYTFPSKRSFHHLIKKCVIILKAQAYNLFSAWSHVFENNHPFSVTWANFDLGKGGRL